MTDISELNVRRAMRALERASTDDGEMDRADVQHLLMVSVAESLIAIAMRLERPGTGEDELEEADVAPGAN